MRMFVVGIGCAALLSAAVATKAAVTDSDSASIFLKIAPVLQSPRCMNCHPSDPFPHQADDQHRHTMWIVRGPNDHGAPGMHCSTCHQAKNNDSSGVPGAPDWHLAPPRLAWQGLTAAEICRSMLDPKRGTMAPNQFDAHFHTAFVTWAWHPGVDSHGRPRTPPPMSFDRFIALTKAWVESGAKCPA